MPGRVLIVTYFFPPVGGVGVQRTLKYATHLPKWGWRPIVVAPRDPAYPLRDPSLLESLDEPIEVHRSFSMEPTRLVRAGRRLLETSSGGHGSPIETRPDLGASGARRGPLRRLLRATASAWTRAWGALLFPEEAVAWLPFALVSSILLARRGSVDAIYSSSPPITTHIVAGLAKSVTGRPWVADFRDPWIGNSTTPHVSKIRRRLQARTERWIVSHADAVVLAVESLRDQFRARYPDIADRFFFIPNGYDRAELAKIPQAPVAHPDRFRLVFAGSLYRDHELEIFLSGLEVLLARRPDLRRRLSVQFVGSVNEANARIGAAHAASLGEVVTFFGFRPRREALAMMATADALLRLMPPDPTDGGLVGAKTLEYLAFDRPILAVVPDGDGRRLIEALPGGRTSDVTPASVATALESLIDDPPPTGGADPTGRYDRFNLAGELARLLDQVAARPDHRSRRRHLRERPTGAEAKDMAGQSNATA
jgi:glycosyltransferase involved in cell wall biosynthesis